MIKYRCPKLCILLWLIPAQELSSLPLYCRSVLSNTTGPQPSTQIKQKWTEWF